ncbi:hypothetical protein TRVA0_018S02212 [Trichomonascus vanleenenianus]|uniref:threonine/serine exporter family protein n=1 Tax=Trichomonascus vanleenenianus TaxID=2268995 RepID=UPI003ECB4361
MASNSQEDGRNRDDSASSSTSTPGGASTTSSSSQARRPMEVRPTVRFQNPPESPPLAATRNFPRHSALARVRNQQSPLSSPPLEATQVEPEDYFSMRPTSSSSFESPPVYVTDSEGASRNLSEVASNMGHNVAGRSAGVQLKHTHADESESDSDYNEESLTRNLLERNASLELPASAQVNDHMSVANNPLQNLFDMGLYTSGGLAPGYPKYTSDGTGNDLQVRRENLLRSIGSLKDKQDKLDELDSSDVETAKGPYGKGTAKDDIELLELDKKLDEEHEKAESKDIAEHLVRSHTLHKRNQSSTSTAAGTQYDARNGYVVSASDYMLPSQDVMYSYDASAGMPENNGPIDERQHEDYVAPPQHIKQGVLGSLLKLYANDEASKSQVTLYSETPGVQTPMSSPSRPSTPASDLGLLSAPKHPLAIGRPKLKPTKSTETTPTVKRPKWYEHKHSRSMSSLGGLVVSASQSLAAPGGGGAAEIPFVKPERPKFVKRASGGVKARKKKKATLEEQVRITVHIADVLQRQRFLLRLCRALMLFGAPTHRLEEYMKMTSRVLEIDGQYLYIPGCMIVSFGDATTHTSEMQLVRCVQGLNLAKLHNVHQIYKEVVHDIINVEEASGRIDKLLACKNYYPNWLCVIFFGLASAMVTPFAFKGWWTDMPISFLLGGAVGVLQVIIAPRSDLYNNVFEVTSSIVVSFIGRAFGSIGKPGEHTFCFSGIAQGSLALILPGYMVLTGSLELQSKNIVPGSIRMFYAIVYSIFLGFGITLGAAIYGWIDSNATSEITCRREVNQWYLFLLVPAFTAFLAAVNQATLRQMPIMVIIGSAGYAVTYFVQKRVSNSSEFTTAIGAFVIGILGNVYSRVGHGLAFAAMLPGIFVQLPGGVAAQGSLVAGIKTADLLVGNLTKHRNGTTTTAIAAATSTAEAISAQQNNAMSLGLTMIQVCVGITVGLFVATLVIYPFGKKRSGLFTF